MVLYSSSSAIIIHIQLREDIKLINTKRLKTDNRGSIVVEACISLIAFIAMLVSIIGLINVFIVHNRIQFAIDSTAKQIAAYSYLYNMSAVPGARTTLQEDGSSYIKKLETVETGITALKSIFDSEDLPSFSELKGNVSDVKSGAEELVSDPYAVAIGALYKGAINGEQFLENKAVGGVAQLLTRQYIAPSEIDANDYLKRFHIQQGYSGLNFGQSTFTHEGGNDRKIIVVIDVTYDIEIPLLNFMLPNGYALTVHQRACAKGFTCGDGNAYVE